MELNFLQVTNKLLQQFIKMAKKINLGERNILFLADDRLAFIMQAANDFLSVSWMKNQW